MNGCYYLHENGDLIYKSMDDVADIRDSPFAVGLWFMDVSDRMTAWNVLVESLAAGAKTERVQALATKWGCDNRDALMYAERIGCALGEDGDKKTATRADFQNLQESPCGFGDTYLAAMADLAKQLGYRPSKMWGTAFRQLLDLSDSSMRGGDQSE